MFLVTAVFSMTEMAVRQETARLAAKHGAEELTSFFTSEAFLSLLPVAALLFLFVLCAGVFMIAGSMNSNVAQRTQLFGMLRCIGMSRKQVIRYVRLEALNWCKSAIPLGLLAGTVVTWGLCAVLKYAVGGEWADMPQLQFSILGLVSGAVVGVLTVLIAAGQPARRAAKVTPVSALSGICEEKNSRPLKTAKSISIEKALGIRHAAQSKKRLFLMIASFALSIILFLSFSVIVDLVNCMMPQSASRADIEIYAPDGEWIENRLLAELEAADGVERVFGRRAVFDVQAHCDDMPSVDCADVISFGTFDLEALKKDALLERNCDLERVISGDAALVISDEEIQKGSEVTVFGAQLPVAGKLKYDPFSSDGSTEGKTTLIVSDEAFRKLTGTADYTVLFVRLSDQAAEKDIDALKTLAGDRNKWIDNREFDTHGTYVAFLVCVYSFLVIIALVSIMNIVNSISLSVSARMKQYGVMRAVGMSKRQLASMVKAEAMTYSCLGCASGLILGLLFSRWLYGFLITSHYPYAHWRFPLAELIVIAAFFALSVLAGVRTPIRRLNEMSVTETIGQL